MLSPATMFKFKKKGLSIVIGYILLVSISIAMSIIVYQWIKNYVPTEDVNCPEGTSIFIKSINYDCTNSILNMTIKNNGKFSINGIYIHATNRMEQGLATIDLSSKIIVGGVPGEGSVDFLEGRDNSLDPNEERFLSFDVSEDPLYRIEIVPTRIQYEKDMKLIVMCGDSEIRETLTCI